MMAQVLVAAWIGVVIGWVGFGVALHEAPADGQMAAGTMNARMAG